jgi:adenylate cyclase
MLDSGLRVETTTIMFADVVESVRLIGLNEFENVQRIRSILIGLAEYTVPSFEGIVLERRGDGLLIKFSEPKLAVACALKIQSLVMLKNSDYVEPKRMFLRIGLHSADVISDKSSVYGLGINIAARVTSLAEPGQIAVSSRVRDCLVSGVDVEIEDMGECYLKHLPEPIHIFRVSPVGSMSVEPIDVPPPTELTPSLAVLPFEAIGDEDSGSAAMLFGETLTHYLARAGSLKVISWLSSKAIASAHHDLKLIGKALSVDWLVTGKCVISGSGASKKILASAQLVHVSSGQIEHSERVSDLLTSLLETECSIAATVAESVSTALTKKEAQRVSFYELPSLASHSLLLGSVGLMHRSANNDFQKSRDALEHLLEREPRLHSARPWLAKWYVLRTTRGLAAASKTAAYQALDQTSRALDSCETDSFALAIQGFIYFHLLKDAERARERLDLSTALNPNESLALVFKAVLTSEGGDAEKAWQLAAGALRVSPFDPMRAYIRMIAASCALSAFSYPSALELAKLSVKENAMHSAAWRVLVIALVQCGLVDEAKDACKRLMLLEPQLTLTGYGARVSMIGEPKRVAISSLALAGVPR